MNFRGFQTKTALVIFFLIIGCGLGIRHLYMQSQVLIPLHKQLTQLPGVVAIEIGKGKGPEQAGTLVSLRLDDEVALGVTLEQVRKVLAGMPGVYTIELEDSADLNLISLFTKIRLAAEEALMTGQFSLMEERVRDLAETQDVVWELSLDREYIYLRLSNRDGMLQRVIKRGQEEGRILISETGQVLIDG